MKFHVQERRSQDERCNGRGQYCRSVLSLVSTYVVCERLSVMHEPAGVVENLVQILQNTPILKYSFRIPPPSPENENCQRSWHFDFSVSEYPPPPPFSKKIEI